MKAGTEAESQPEWSPTVRALLKRFVLEETAQDLIEYALLTGIITVGSILLLLIIRTQMQTAYVTWGTAAQDRWDPADPLTSTP
jgi:Flp pilus assembly pilin Flp